MSGVTFDSAAIDDKLRRLQALIAQAPEIIGQEAENFYKDSFIEQGWRDGGLERWPSKRTPNGYPALRSRNPFGLADTIRFRVVDDTTVEILAGGPDKPYAGIHNTGGIITVEVTEKMKRFAWAMYYKTGDGMWRGIALTQKSFLQIVMPKRQYMGASRDLEKAIFTTFKNAITRILND